MVEWRKMKNKPKVHGLVAVQFAADRYGKEHYTDEQRAYELTYSDMN